MKTIKFVSAVTFIFLLIAVSFEANAVTRYGEVLCQSEGYTCHKVAKGETWATLFPDEQARSLAMRINRMNIPLRTGMVIAMPTNPNNLDYFNHSPFDLEVISDGKRFIVVDPTKLAWGAYDESGNLVHWGPVAMGKSWCPDIQRGCRTTIGNFKVYREGSSACKSSKFPIPNGGAPMPYCMFFKGGYAMHASNDVPGYHASHGCVRMFYEDAQWLNLDFVDPGTTVIVKPYGPFSA